MPLRLCDVFGEASELTWNHNRVRGALLRNHFLGGDVVRPALASHLLAGPKDQSKLGRMGLFVFHDHEVRPLIDGHALPGQGTFELEMYPHP